MGGGCQCAIIELANIQEELKLVKSNISFSVFFLGVGMGGGGLFSFLFKWKKLLADTVTADREKCCIQNQSHCMKFKVYQTITITKLLVLLLDY